MPQTYAVSFDLGPGKAGAIVGAALGTRQISATEQLVIHYTACIADSNGHGVLYLWSNEALNNGSTYTVATSHQSGDTVQTGGFVPVRACTLGELFDQTPVGALAITAGALAITDGYLVLGA